ncbi:hypothetical protein Y1Q_0001208 [Alligator mississippiensis]|uniref:Uncharacterized protein n=1 Tax=Alligator mississippiensis TaxID=8496 RepID=A0A151PEG9_ALLMI|nr:hypothetical protein Y1Q_0001208 [Alligator mississippiensis]
MTITTHSVSLLAIFGLPEAVLEKDCTDKSATPSPTGSCPPLTCHAALDFGRTSQERYVRRHSKQPEEQGTRRANRAVCTQFIGSKRRKGKRNKAPDPALGRDGISPNKGD